jgi:hypothetical protein
MNVEMSEILEITRSAGVIIASSVAIWGINSWRREAKWKRKYELAEEVLANIYEAHQAIQFIRSPFGSGNEGSSRPKLEDETIQQSQIYDQAYVSRERFERNKAALEKLRALKFRFIAIHGKEYEKHFDKFTQTVNKVFFASDEIARVRLGHYGDDQKVISETMKESREILYSRSNKEDKIESELIEAVSAMEKKCNEIIGNNN